MIMEYKKGDYCLRGRVRVYIAPTTINIPNIITTNPQIGMSKLNTCEIPQIIIIKPMNKPKIDLPLGRPKHSSLVRL